MDTDNKNKLYQLEYQLKFLMTNNNEITNSKPNKHQFNEKLVSFILT